MNKKVTITASSLIVTAILLGAFGAHALKEIISSERLITFETGVRYQMYVGISLLILALNEDQLKIQMGLVNTLMLSGILLFSGSIYLISLSDVWLLNTKILGPLTPIGGSCLILGWLFFIYRIWRFHTKS